jgi:hypothetical protein
MSLDPKDSSVYHLLCVIVSAMVDQTEAVLILPVTQPEGVSFSIKVDRQDIGKVIGKQGRNAQSLRIIISAVGMKMRRRYTLDIMTQPAA